MYILKKGDFLQKETRNKIKKKGKNLNNLTDDVYISILSYKIYLKILFCKNDLLFYFDFVI